MQQVQLTEETPVSISPPYSPVLSPQQSELLPEGQESHTPQEGVQANIETNLEVEATGSEIFVAPTPNKKEFQTQSETVDMVLARLQRQCNLVSGLNSYFVYLSLNVVTWLLIGILFHKAYEDEMAYMRANHIVGVTLTDFGLYFLGIAGVFFVPALASVGLRPWAQRKRDALTRALAQSDDRRVVGPLVRALGMRELRGVLLDALNRLLPLQSEDPRDVGPLIEMLPWLESLFAYDLVLRADILATVERLIPRMTRADADRLDASQRNALNCYLGRNLFTLREGDDPNSPFLLLKLFAGHRKVSLRSDEKDLALAILRAYPVIGDGTEMPHVRNVAQGKGNAGTDVDVRLAAWEYLDLVEARKQQEKLGNTLLRASSASEIGADTLLRAAQENQSAPSDELLRPATNENGPISL